MLEFLTTVFNPDYVARTIKGKKNAIILLYHSPDPEVFEKHVNYLKQYYKFISLDKLVKAIKNKNWSSIPANALVFTFDDGHISNYRLKEIFIRYQINPTIYLCSGVIGTNSKFWWQEFNAEEAQALKFLPNKQRLQLLGNVEKDGLAEEKEPSALTTSQIAEMSAYVDFQSHTRNHPIVTMLDKDELEDELNGPIEDMKAHNLNITHFAFPNGDYSSREIKYLAKCGYSSARTIDIGWNNLKTDLFKLKIQGVSDNASIPKLRLQISGLSGWIYHIIKSKNLKGKKKIISKNQ
jgi:peptidoglycan/xylan/chitin deacetylase (PgdA/CDA1 family)